MDGRGGCCIARYVPGVDKIMLRFRPIAPKPVAGPTASDASSSESGDAFLKSTTPKRKYVRDNNKRGTRRRKNNVNTSTPVVTLPLLPETPDPKVSPARDLSRPAADEEGKKKLNMKVAVWPGLEKRSMTMTKAEPYGAMGGRCSCVTVECVTETWVEGEWLGSTDEERRAKLSRDTCPGFISDGYGRVTWTNEAYGEMMKGEGEGQGQGRVLLVMKVSAVVAHPSFTCRVRVVQYTCGRERSSLTVPCDVWRMDSGGFAWRLDVKTALSLRFGY
ncbi:uncharacterized protein LOC109800914 [Cajanus cajan]|uniref:DUF7950 domain-containing protein n=1 Tax=Cajanus cajan TaxID=3821 RepID=A0A151TE40_CAJCA|nr:uncharacterized protein LOC109800914 [Cajanus cajan]KYP65312.1 hypothetical protein KK1_011545 [Cajanus cajan]